MALYRYVKRQNSNSVLTRMPSISRQKKRVPRKILAGFSVTFLLVGFFMLGQVILPLAGWYFLTLPEYMTSVVSPLGSKFQSKTEVLAASTTMPAQDSYDVNSWFVGVKPKASGQTLGESGLKVYNLSIPKLKIDQAIVEVGSNDLKKSLIGWPTSPLPGRFGNNIIFGHSELPQFATPTNYSGIFTHLMDLTIGDEILVDYDGIRYKYEVIDKAIVEPTNLSVLEQRFDSAYITLITCTPPGTVWKRGIIKGKLAEF